MNIEDLILNVIFAKQSQEYSVISSLRISHRKTIRSLAVLHHQTIYYLDWSKLETVACEYV